MGDMARKLGIVVTYSKFKEGGKKIETVKPTPQHDKRILCFFVVVLDFVPDFWRNTTVSRHSGWGHLQVQTFC